MSKTTACYLAGFFDGEAYFGLMKTKKGNKKEWHSKRDYYYLPVIKVASVDKEIIIWLKDSFGGTMETRVFKNKNQKTAYTWSLRGTKQAEKIIRKVYPFLRIKQKPAEVLLKFFKTISYGKPIKTFVNEERDNLYKEIRKLNFRGKDILHAERLSE